MRQSQISTFEKFRRKLLKHVSVLAATLRHTDTDGFVPVPQLNATLLHSFEMSQRDMPY